MRRSHEVGQATTAVVEIHPKKTHVHLRKLLLVTNFRYHFVHYYRGSFFVWGGNMDEEESTPNLKRLRGRSLCKPV